MPSVIYCGNYGFFNICYIFIRFLAIFGEIIGKIAMKRLAKYYEPTGYAEGEGVMGYGL